MVTLGIASSLTVCNYHRIELVIGWAFAEATRLATELGHSSNDRVVGATKSCADIPTIAPLVAQILLTGF